MPIVKTGAQLRQLGGSAAIDPGARVIPSPKKLASRVPLRRISSKINIRLAKSKAVTRLVRARERQARAAIWSPFRSDSATGGKAEVFGA
jgi:hypothetical protein